MLRVKNIENTHFIMNWAVGVKFTIEELEDFNSIEENKEITEMIAAHMNQQRKVCLDRGSTCGSQSRGCWVHSPELEQQLKDQVAIPGEQHHQSPAWHNQF